MGTGCTIGAITGIRVVGGAAIAGGVGGAIGVNGAGMAVVKGVETERSLGLNCSPARKLNGCGLDRSIGVNRAVDWGDDDGGEPYPGPESLKPLNEPLKLLIGAAVGAIAGLAKLLTDPAQGLSLGAGGGSSDVP